MVSKARIAIGPSVPVAWLASRFSPPVRLRFRGRHGASQSRVSGPLLGIAQETQGASSIVDCEMSGEVQKVDEYESPERVLDIEKEVVNIAGIVADNTIVKGSEAGNSGTVGLAEAKVMRTLSLAQSEVFARINKCKSSAQMMDRQTASNSKLAKAVTTVGDPQLDVHPP
eukprot:1289435-Amphidinium_carterae.1